MDLDDFRRQWRAPLAADMDILPITPDAMQTLLKRASTTAFAKMRRNIRLEMASALILLPLCAWVILHPASVERTAIAVWVALLCLSGLFGYYRHLQLLKPVAGQDEPLRQHTARQVATMRTFIAQNNKLAGRLVAIPYLLIFVIFVGQTSRMEHGWKLVFYLGVMGILFTLIGWLFSRLTVNFVREMMQRLYGQHLDRLEATLRELSADEAA